MIVISLVGPSAAGKSTVVKHFADRVDTIEESYIELDRHELDSRWTLSKWNFMANWFNRILEKRQDGVSIVMTDRSPLCSAAYVVRGKEEYLNLALHSLDELTRLGVHCYPVLLTARLPVLLERTTRRLKAEPWRARYHEQDGDRAESVRNYFEERSAHWSHVVDTSELGVEQVCTRVESIMHESMGNHPS
jgi:thymidylate kinase